MAAEGRRGRGRGARTARPADRGRAARPAARRGRPGGRPARAADQDAGTGPVRRAGEAPRPQPARAGRARGAAPRSGAGEVRAGGAALARHPARPSSPWPACTCSRAIPTVPSSSSPASAASRRRCGSRSPPTSCGPSRPRPGATTSRPCARSTARCAPRHRTSLRRPFTVRADGLRRLLSRRIERGTGAAAFAVELMSRLSRQLDPAPDLVTPGTAPAHPARNRHPALPVEHARELRDRRGTECLHQHGEDAPADGLPKARRRRTTRGRAPREGAPAPLTTPARSFRDLISCSENESFSPCAPDAHRVSSTPGRALATRAWRSAWSRVAGRRVPAAKVGLPALPTGFVPRDHLSALVEAAAATAAGDHAARPRRRRQDAAPRRLGPDVARRDGVGVPRPDRRPARAPPGRGGARRRRVRARPRRRPRRVLPDDPRRAR